MRKTLIIVSILIIGLTGCADDKASEPQLNLLSYPQQINPGNDFEIRGEYLTKKPGGETVKVNLTIRKLDNNQGLITKEKKFNNQSQTISFSEINLGDITLGSGLYFELKLVIDGKFQQKVTTKSDPSLVANWHKNIITTYFRPAYYENGDEKLTSFGKKLSEENPYYFALPYRPYYQGKIYKENPDLYGYDMVKNKWIKINYQNDSGKTRVVYAQWEDVGPWNVYDPYYVFGTNEDRPYAETGIDMGWTGKVRKTNKAGLDISPAAISYLAGGTKEDPACGKIEVNWRFVAEDKVPQDGPWWPKRSSGLVIPEKANYNTNTLRTNN